MTQLRHSGTNIHACSQAHLCHQLPPNRSRYQAIPYDKHICKERHLAECFINKIKHLRRVATRYEKLAANFLAMVKLAAIRTWRRPNESTT